MPLLIAGTEPHVGGVGTVVQTPEREASVPEDVAAVERSVDGARTVRIAVIWGYPRRRPEATESVDWSGSLSVENAALRLVRPRQFEETDAVVRPRTNIHTIEFESQTGPDADGLLLDVILAPALNPDGRPVTLTFTSRVFTASLTIDPGMQRVEVIPVDDAGHVLVFRVIRPLRPDDPPKASKR